MEAVITFSDGVTVSDVTEPMPMKVTFYFEDGPAIEDTIGSDMTIVLAGGIGPMGLPGPQGPAGEPVEITQAEIDEILGIDEEEDDGGT